MSDKNKVIDPETGLPVVSAEGEGAEGAEGIEGTEKAGGEEAEGTKGKEGEGAEGVGDAEEKTPIPEEERKKFKIPEKFKFWEDVVKWGSEAEKAKSRAESDKDRFKADLEERERIISELSQKEKEGEITEEQREQMTMQFRNEWDKDPVACMEKLFAAHERIKETSRERTEQQKTWKKEETEIREKYGDDVWTDTLKPALIKIANDRPYLKNLKEALAIYELEKKDIEAENATDARRKKTEKEKAFSEGGRGKAEVPKNVFDAIAAATNDADLEKAVVGHKK